MHGTRGRSTLSTVLGATWILQAEQGVIHLVAEHLWQPQVHTDLVTAPSRNFH